MRRAWLALAVAIPIALPVALPAANAAADGPPADTHEAGRTSLIAASRVLHDAWASGNPDVVGPLLDPAYALTDARGRRHDRAWALAQLRRRDVDLSGTESTLDDLHVTLAGDAGIVSGLARDLLHLGDWDEHRVRRFTEVWTRTSGHWILLATHESGAEVTRARVTARPGR